MYGFNVGRDTLRVPVSLFWSKSSASNIYQNFKGTNFPLERASDSCDDISGRHVNHVIETRKLLMSRNTIIFLLTRLGFVINSKKSILVVVQQIEFLGLEIL